MNSRLFYLELGNGCKTTIAAEGVLEAYEVLKYYEWKFGSKWIHFFEIKEQDIQELIPIN